MSEHDHDHALPPVHGDAAEVRAKYQRLLQMAEHMRHVIVMMKELVPKAFEEGFRRRNPEQEEPWLIDWLQSEAKQRLDTLMPRPPGPPMPAPGAAPAASDAVPEGPGEK